jgi:hypothetical protein
VSSVSIGSGVISVTYGHEANTKIKTGGSNVLTLKPGASDNGDVIWKCGRAQDPSGWGTDIATGTATTTVVGKYLPSSCR